MGVSVGAREEELQDKKKENLEASILVHRRYRNVIQHIHAYRWQHQGDGLEDRREGEDQREGEDRGGRGPVGGGGPVGGRGPSPGGAVAEKIKDSLKRYCGDSMHVANNAKYVAHGTLKQVMPTVEGH